MVYPYLHLQIGPLSVSLHFSFASVHLFVTSAHVIAAQINSIFFIITQLVVHLFYEMILDVLYKNVELQIWHLCECSNASKTKSSN